MRGLIDAYARALPDASAVLFQGRQLPSGDLWLRVDQVGRDPVYAT